MKSVVQVLINMKSGHIEGHHFELQPELTRISLQGGVWGAVS